MAEKDLQDVILILRIIGLKNIYTHILELGIIWFVKIPVYSFWKWETKDSELVAKELVIIYMTDLGALFHILPLHFIYVSLIRYT